MRFNKKGGFNTPFCKKTERFSKSYITKICNQVKNIQNLINVNDYTFICEDFNYIINLSNNNDLIYCDPPYIDRSSDYFTSWNEECEFKLYESLLKVDSKFLLSTWYKTKHRENKYVDILWSKFNINEINHFYHL